MRSQSMRNCHSTLTSNKSTTNGTLSSISLWKASAPGANSVALFMLVRTAWEADTKAWSIITCACLRVEGLFSCTRVHITVHTIWCMRLHIPFDAGLWLVVDTPLIPKSTNNCWNSQPVDSPPISWQQVMGQGYFESQHSSNFTATWNYGLVVNYGLILQDLWHDRCKWEP